MNLKYLDKQRAEKLNKIEEILEGAKKEERTSSEDEISKFNELKKLIGEIDATIQAEKESRQTDIEDKNKESENVENQESKKPATEDEKKEDHRKN